MTSTRRSFLACGAAAGAALLAGSRAIAATTAPNAASADLWEVFRTRRSVRHFKPDPVPDEDLKRMIDAARLAPTSGNQQPWKFLVVRDPARIAALKQAGVDYMLTLVNAKMPAEGDAKKRRDEKIRTSLDGYLSAPVVIVALTDRQSKYPDYNHWDGPLAVAQLMLAARALGYGTVFMTDSIPEEVTRKVFAIPDRYVRVCVTPVGVPVEWPAAPSKKPLEDFIAYETL